MALKTSHAGPLSVSVAMCTYNGATFLSQQLESILRQTSLPDEMVVCDDGSTDETLSLLERFAREAPFPVLTLRNATTLRPAQNFAKCIGLCTGDVIVLTDQDDVWFLDRIVNTRQAFNADPALAFLFSDCPLIDETGAPLGRSIYTSVPLPRKDRKRILQGDSLLPVLMRWGVLYGTSMAFRASLRPLLLPLPGLWSHDEWIALTLSAAGTSARLPTPVTHYRRHVAQQVGTGDWTLQTHLGVAKKNGADHYEAELHRYRQAIAAVQPHPVLHAALLPELQQKERFLLERRKVQTGGMRALPALLRLVVRGKYRRYGSSVRSPLKDLLMLSGFLSSTR